MSHRDPEGLRPKKIAKVNHDSGSCECHYKTFISILLCLAPELARNYPASPSSATDTARISGFPGKADGAFLCNRHKKARLL